VRAATNAGYATMAWSRPGNGRSSSGNAYSILQTEIQAAVLIELTKLLRSGKLQAGIPKPTGRVLHMGHSFGSALSNILIAKNPELSDGVVLTGLSHNMTLGSPFPALTNFHLAKENQPERFGNFSTGILTWADELALQYGFFKHPYFDPKVLAYTEASKGPFGKSLAQMIVWWTKY
jgi:pimeloyl-ACP methyl ester carboxylesterase